MRISDWSSDVCSSDLLCPDGGDRISWLGFGRRGCRAAGSNDLRPRAGRRAGLRGCEEGGEGHPPGAGGYGPRQEIGRAEGRERGWQSGYIRGVDVSIKKRIKDIARTREINTIK